MTSIENIERSVNNFLQNNLCFALENKILKRGKLILFSIKDFYCTFTLICQEKNNKKIIFEIPYPFAFLHKQKEIVFDYSISSFVKNNNQIEPCVAKVSTVKPSKYLNKKITITVL
jgi:hypothetical protein